MYVRLAIQNVKKSYHEFLIYFMTLMFSVCLFYMFNSFQAQQEMMVLKESDGSIFTTISIFMAFLSVFVVLTLAFLMVYANRFLIRRRKKEFGLYMLMGMPNRMIARILMYETILIGCISLVFGLLLGVAISQLFAVITAKLFAIEVNFKFIFSPNTACITILLFSMIFLVLFILNVRMLRKQELITFLSANKQQEKQRLVRLVSSVMILLCSLVCITTTYYLATSSLLLFANMLPVILFLGAIGTILFFYSLCGFLLRFIKTSKRIYLRNLNMFVLRQIHARINTNFLSMSAVCLLLLLAIGALSTGWNLNEGMKNIYEISSPFSMSLHIEEEQQEIENLQYDASQVQSEHWYSFYDADVVLSDLLPYLNQDSDALSFFAFDNPIMVMKYSDYQEFCLYKDMNAKPITNDEYLMFTSIDGVYEVLQDVQMPLTVFKQTLQPASAPLQLMPYNDIISNIPTALILPDEVVPIQLQPTHSVWNVELNKEAKLQAFQKNIDAQLKDSTLQWRTITKQEIYDNVITLGILFTYIGLYLGIVFLMASAVILALQQLSEADENRKRYELLAKLGVEKKTMHHAIFLQIAIYFLLPLGLAILHSYFGIQAVAGSFSIIFGIGNMVTSSLHCACIILLIYGVYFLLTYQGYKRILFQNM